MHYFFIVNPQAGQGRTGRLWPQMAADLERRRVDFSFVLTSGPGEATELARDIVAAGHRTVVGVGGDGTLHEILAGLDSESALGVLPLGTGNDFAHALGFPKEPQQAIQALLDAKPRRIDLPRVNDRPYLNMAGVGFDAAVAKQVRDNPPRGRGALPYLITVLRMLITYQETPLRITLDGQVIDTRAFMVAVGNGCCAAGGMRVCPKARLDDGLLDVCIVGAMNKISALSNLARSFRGTHIHHPKITYHRARSIRIEGANAPLYADGEPLGHTPVEFSIQPTTLTVLAPLQSARTENRDGQPKPQDDGENIAQQA